MRPVTFLATFWSFSSDLTSHQTTWSGQKPAGDALFASAVTKKPGQDPVNCSQKSFVSEPGLPLCREIVYNDRQNLPLMTGNLPMAPDGSSLTSEADMKPARPERTSSSRPAVSKSGGAAGVETRAERLARIRREIQDGTYESEEKLERAIERMLGVLHTAND